LDFDDVSVYEMNLMKSANGFDEVSQLAEMSQHLKNPACGCLWGQRKIV